MKLGIMINLFILKLNYLFLILKYNKISIQGHMCVRKIKIKNNGENNSIIAGRHVVLKNCKFCFKGNNHKVIFDGNINISGVSFNLEKDNSIIKIGKGAWIGDGCELTAMAGTQIDVGALTLLAPNCHVRTSDSHVIYQDGTEINKPKDIIIGKRCWLGDRVFVLKGAVIQDGCIVGACSVVTSKSMSEPNCILCGIPAKNIKKGIKWEL